jgi:hypothetical protein
MNFAPFLNKSHGSLAKVGRTGIPCFVENWAAREKITRDVKSTQKF